MKYARAIYRRRTARHRAEKDLCTIGRQVNRSIGGMADCRRAESVEFALELRNPAGTLTLKNDYTIEPLIIRAATGEWTATAYLQKLEAELEELKRAVSSLSDGYEALKETVSGLPAAIEEAKKQAVIEAAGGDPMGA